MCGPSIAPGEAHLWRDGEGGLWERVWHDPVDSSAGAEPDLVSELDANAEPESVRVRPVMPFAGSVPARAGTSIEDCQTTDERWLLWGTKATPLGGGWTRLSEERVRPLALPPAQVWRRAASAPVQASLKDTDLPLRLRVRHIVSQDDHDAWLPSFGDTRFVDLRARHGELLMPIDPTTASVISTTDPPDVDPAAEDAEGAA